MSRTHPKRFRAIAKYDGPQHEPKYWAVVDDQERVIVDTLNADSRWNADEQEVFVRMIVAAVNSHADLLAACEAMVSAWGSKSPLAWQPENNPALLDGMSAAISKARGHQ